ncbi:hypothetical protein HPB50_026570 [Hyalomma asiaticum]|uniref:Uncharacterized protein n=1 Tax=Hyalomma asiaticum TaxID=266040 RepID=A0ACB7TUX5_HYAAI|nr:hypothetical protein HPB50_026570 [Hyalomma asiaticum]
MRERAGVAPIYLLEFKKLSSHAASRKVQANIEFRISLVTLAAVCTSRCQAACSVTFGSSCGDATLNDEKEHESALGKWPRLAARCAAKERVEPARAAAVDTRSASRCRAPRGLADSLAPLDP